MGCGIGKETRKVPTFGFSEENKIDECLNRNPFSLYTIKEEFSENEQSVKGSKRGSIVGCFCR